LLALGGLACTLSGSGAPTNAPNALATGAAATLTALASVGRAALLLSRLTPQVRFHQPRQGFPIEPGGGFHRLEQSAAPSAIRSLVAGLHNPQVFAAFMNIHFLVGGHSSSVTLSFERP
jgi:hypothetical protein